MNRRHDVPGFVLSGDDKLPADPLPNAWVLLAILVRWTGTENSTFPRAETKPLAILRAESYLIVFFRSRYLRRRVTLEDAALMAVDLWDWSKS
jgi:hypothetical protein